MASRTDITGEKLLEWLTWDWQDLEALKQRLIGTVPPGRALRSYQTRSRAQKGVRPLTEDEQIASGARAIVTDRISALISSGKIEWNDDRTLIRRVERRVVDKTGCCPTCQRPFSQAAEEKLPPPPPPKSKVVYPSFPAWNREWDRKLSGET